MALATGNSFPERVHVSTSHFARPAQIAGEATAQIATSVRAGCPLQTTNTTPSGRIGWLAPVPIFAALAIASLASAFAQTIPPDAKPTCTVTAAVFKTWFTSGTPVLNGVVNPANSVTFPNTPNCSFYQWAMQDFLWVTSPSPALYGGSGRIMDSPAFYDVSPPDGSGNRTFIPHTTGGLRLLSVRAAQPGPHGLPVIFDTQGRMLEILKPTLAPSGNPLLRNAAGASVEIQRATVANGKASFLDKAGKAVPNAKPIIPSTLNPALTVQKFTVGPNIIFVNGLGNVVPVEQGQADGSVLESQNGSLVYYALMVNDVYAYFLTGSKDNKILPMPTTFPTTAAALNQIVAFAAAQVPPKTFPDSVALAIELKTSWVLASSVPNNGSGYITMTASVPTYTKNAQTWTAGPNQTVLLAMVGIHVVGSAAGHPEMIRATFEHFGNASDGASTYMNNHNPSVLTSVGQNTAGTWLFSQTGASSGFNTSRMQVSPPNIVAVPATGTISPSNTLRVNAWGANASTPPNPLDTVAQSNTDIIPSTTTSWG
jgi:hypothetical protein